MEDSFINPDKNLIQKLKLQSPEHFQHLVKMHLSFSLEINLDELDECDEKKFRVLKWAFPFSKKEKSTKEISKVTDTEITAITENTIAQMYQIIQFLSQEENVSEEGIFRISGAVSRQKLLINYLKNRTEINLNDKQFTVHDCATVLKTFLSNLSEPLITDAYYPVYCHVAELCKQSESTTKGKLLDCLRLMMLLLPYENAVILRHIILLLHLTSNYSQKNKMSAENLATLFTPHLFCPRKLCGEALHANSQLLWSTAVFMIQYGPELFEIPSGLLADVKLYWAEKNRRQLSPKDNLMDESTTDSGAVNTVFSFVDREKTAQENISNPTETALAQLYAHIQSLPESNKKRRLVKQFNKENGYGTPKKLLIQEDRSHLTRRNLCDSLKKHIFHNKVNKPSSSSISKITSKTEVLPQPESTSESKSSKKNALKYIEKSLDCRECGCSDISDEYSKPSNSPVYRLSDNLLPENQSGNDALMVNLPSDHNLLLTNQSDDNIMSDKSEDDKEIFPEDCWNRIPSCNNLNADGADEVDHSDNKLPENFGRYSLHSPNWRRYLKTVSSCPNLTTPSFSSKIMKTVTSTPAPYPFNSDCLVTPPFHNANEDMSPITMSAQKMPKAMQEVMMTPRSRRPVVANSGSSMSQTAGTTPKKYGNNRPVAENSNISDNYSSQSASGETDEETKSYDESSKFIPSDLSSGQEVLSKTFQEYLLSRSMQTATPPDSSFFSETDDISTADEKLSESLLYCLDGNVPQAPSDTSVSEKNIHETVL